MTRQEAIDELHKHYVPEYVNYIVTALTDGATPSDAPTIKELAQEPCDDTVSRGVFEQVMWERDMAIEQLRKLGYELGQKIEPCEDCVSRSAVKNGMIKYGFHASDMTVTEFVEDELAPVLPKREGNIVSEEVYTSEYTNRKDTEYKFHTLIDEIRAEINTPNRGTCDYFIVDMIEKIINKYAEMR